MKKLLTILFASMVVFSLAMPVFADDAAAPAATTKAKKAKKAKHEKKAKTEKTEATQ